jgi:hypothetical protein
MEDAMKQALEERQADFELMYAQDVEFGYRMAIKDLRDIAKEEFALAP